MNVDWTALVFIALALLFSVYLLAGRSPNRTNRAKIEPKCSICGNTTYTLYYVLRLDSVLVYEDGTQVHSPDSMAVKAVLCALCASKRTTLPVILAQEEMKYEQWYKGKA